MIRIAVTSEDDVLRMSAVFRRDDDLRDCDYEIWLVSGFGPGGGGAMLRRWRKDGRQGAASTGNTAHFAGGYPLTGGGGGGEGGSSASAVPGA